LRYTGEREEEGAGAKDLQDEPGKAPCRQKGEPCQQRQRERDL
jgi:hypothetical protein